MGWEALRRRVPFAQQQKARPSESHMSSGLQRLLKVTTIALWGILPLMTFSMHKGNTWLSQYDILHLQIPTEQTYQTLSTLRRKHSSVKGHLFHLHVATNPTNPRKRPMKSFDITSPSNGKNPVEATRATPSSAMTGTTAPSFRDVRGTNTDTAREEEGLG